MSVSDKMQTASYQVAEKIIQETKPHTAIEKLTNCQLLDCEFFGNIAE